MLKKISIIFVIFSILMVTGYTSSGVIPAKVYIENVDVSNLSITEAEKKVKANYKRIYFRYKTISCSFAPEDLGIIIDYESTFEKLKQKNIWEKILMNFKETRIILKKDINQEKLEQTLNHLSKAFSIKPKDATFSIVDGKLIQKKEQWGSVIDVKLLKSNIINNCLFKEYIIPFRTIEPEIKLQDLKELRPDTVLAQYTTEFVKNYNRTENIKVACETLKNTLIKPGEVFSFNQKVGPREEERGYLNAMIISGGEFIPGLGGGVCQVSSTLYNAILLAGLEIIERHPHSLKINYVPLGRDATVNYGFKDLKFKNNTGGFLRLDYKIEGQKLTFILYGTQKWSQRIKVKDIKSEVIKVIEPSEKVKLSDNLPLDEIRVVKEGNPGYIVNTYRIVEENGIIKEEFLFKDYYRPLPRVVEKSIN